MKYYRPNVGMCIINSEGLIFGARRTGLNLGLGDEKAWQMPQGGVRSLANSSSLIEGMYKELWEETGLRPEHVQILRKSPIVRYDFDLGILKRLVNGRVVVGQEQIWFYLNFVGKDSDFCLDNEMIPEFDEWRWCTADFLIENVIEMKRDVYEKILTCL